MSTKNSLPGYKELPPGGIIPEGGTANNYKTGGWRSKRPVFQSEACVHCLTCWILCPDNSVLASQGKVIGYDYDHCKGCGICAFECPVNKSHLAGKAKKGPAIIMQEENPKEKSS
ncbi:MAG: 4Fe-4S binding protein [Candidatus Riflebacteria bacterium]|nr:4Fe-4S binding protein [Candidatus Riflebacteria bacterium]